MAAINPTISITFADTGTPALTATEVQKLTAAIIALMGARTITATYAAASPHLTLAIT